MARQILLGEVSPVLRDNVTMLTPNEHAAATLDAQHLSLESMARLSLDGVGVADPARVARLSREAVRDVLGAADTQGLARAMLPVVREVFRAGADLDAEPASPRARHVFAVARIYHRLLRDCGLIDPAEALREAAESMQQRQVQVWGYPRLGADEISFLDAAAADGSEIYLPYAEDPVFRENRQTAEEFQQRGWEVEISARPSPWLVNGVTATAYSYPHKEAEVRGALARVKTLLAEGVSAAEIVLVARDEASYGPTVLAVAREYGVQVRALYRVPLAQTRLGSWLSLLLETCAAGFPFEPTAELLRHPFGPGFSSEQWSAARSSQASGPAGWANAGVDLTNLDVTLWPEENDRSGWLTQIETFLEDHGIYERVDAWSREAVALSHLEDGLRWLCSPEEETVRRDQFLSEFTELLYLATAPEHPEDGVALETPLSLFGARRHHVFALGLTEGEFPASVAEDPVLDFRERRALADEDVRLESAAARARRERLSFYELLQVPTGSLTMSYSRLVERQSTLQSPYFGLLHLDPEALDAPPLTSPEERRQTFLGIEDDAQSGDPVLRSARKRWQVELRRESPEPFDEHDGVVGVPVQREGRFSVTELGDLARCGFRWWSGRVLRLSEPEEGESPALIGSINHYALEEAVRSAVNDGFNGEHLRSAVLERLELCFEAAERRHGTHSIRSWYLRRGEHLQRLRRAVEGEEFLMPGAEVVAVEEAFVGEWRGFSVRGRLDRVDQTSEGAVVVDYKSGSGASLPTPDFQLTVYEEAAEEAVSGAPVERAYYYSLRKGERVRIRKPDVEEQEEVARRMKAALSNGRLPPDALEHDTRGKVCETCAFDVVCRRGPRLRNKPPWEAE